MQVTSNDSRSYIVQSLLLLMQDKAYNEISISDVSKKSGVSRRTVYRYFDNKEAILSSHIVELKKEFIPYVSEDIRTGRNIVENCFRFIDKHYDFFKAAYRNDLLVNIVDILREVIKEVVQHAAPAHYDSDFLDNYTSYIAGGCWGLLGNWIRTDKKQSPYEMYLTYKKIARDLDTRLSGGERA